MALSLTIDLNEQDLAHFTGALKAAYRAAGDRSQDEIVAAATALLEDAQKVQVPDFIRQRLERLDDLMWSFEPDAFIPHEIAGTGFDDLARRHERPIYASLDEVDPANARPVVVADSIDVRAATLCALDLLEDSPQGYFLMVEWDAHTDDVRKGLQNVVDFDRLMAEVEQRVDLDDTLLIFTADHSFGLQVDGGQRGEPLLAGYEEWKQSGNNDDVVRLQNVMVNRTHTAEEVMVLATGAGAHRVRGYFPGTQLFDVMLDAWGWNPDGRVAGAGE